MGGRRRGASCRGSESRFVLLSIYIPFPILTSGYVQIQNPMSLDTRTEFHRVVITVSSSSSSLKAYTTGGQRSSRIASLSGANGLVILPATSKEELGKEGVMEKGSVVEAVVIGEIQVE